MKSWIGLTVGACAVLLPAMPAFAEDPPDDVRLFYYADNDHLSAYVDFANLDTSGRLVEGWTYQIYSQPQTFEGMDEQVGSYWEYFGGDCRKKVVYSYGLIMLDEDAYALNEIDEDAKPVVRKANKGSFDEELLSRVCAGSEPTDEPPFLSADDAKEAVRFADGLFSDDDD